MRESKIEKDGKKFAKKTGWFHRKTKSPANNGFPDDIFIKEGVHVWVEFKRTSKDAELLQKEVHRQMRAHGAIVKVINSYEDFVTIFTSYNFLIKKHHTFEDPYPGVSSW